MNWPESDDNAVVDECSAQHYLELEEVLSRASSTVRKYCAVIDKDSTEHLSNCVRAADLQDVLLLVLRHFSGPKTQLRLLRLASVEDNIPMGC
ncbi:MAG: Phosphotransferase enzyme [Chaenotheca gracillima]|nr:MAG: Phosphotransferase enzyme [Chaenotheca gracillima]